MASPLEYLSKVNPPAPTYRRGTGPDALQYGQATALNRGAAAARPPTAPASPGGVAPPTAPAPAKFVPRTDEEKFLFAPTERPNEPVSAGVMSFNRVAVPADVLDWLPLLGQVAHGPEASPALQALYSRWAFELSREA